MANICLGNLLPSSVLAYDNRDLIPNGYIPEIGTTARPSSRGQGSQVISQREVVRLLPSDRLYAEFWFGVKTRVTGTSLNDLSPGGNAGFIAGSLGLGGAVPIASALGCSLQGNSERTISKWVFHVCESQTKINREFIITEENISNGYIILPDYILGVLGITKKPIEFVTQSTLLTEEQISRAKSFTSDEVEAALGRRVAPEELTDSDIRVLLGLSDFNELENLGNSGGRIRGWPQSFDGQIQAEFKNYKYSDNTNLFTGIIRDDRKNLYRADNEFDKNNGHCFWNGSHDDITDKIVSFRLVEDEGNENEQPLKVGDKVYISYVAASPIFRYATENITNFFLFPDQSVYQLPPLDLVKGWCFKKFITKVRKDVKTRPSIEDIQNDNNIQSQISVIRNDLSITEDSRNKKIEELSKKILLEEIECQRLIESKLEKANKNPFIIGCYFADSRGILSYNFRTNEINVLIQRGEIRDQSWFNSFLEDMISSSSSFDSSGQLSFTGDNIRAFFDDFLFDVSDHVNSVCYDNEKFGYERRLARAIQNCSIYNENEDGTGVGFPNLDLIKNNTSNREMYDLTSAKFDSIPMQGSSSLYTCNVTFTYDFGFCTKGTIQADMILRTPTFLQELGSNARIYVEKFQANNPLTPDGGIWVGTNPVVTQNYSVTTDYTKYHACLVYPETSDGTMRYRMFEEGVLNNDFKQMSNNDPVSSDNSLLQLDNSLTTENIKYGGYDKILGDQPGYYKGIEISTENALIILNRISPSVIKVDRLSFTKDEENGRINVNGLSNKKAKKITISYKVKNKAFLDDPKRLISFVFPSTKSIIDNIALPYQGVYNNKDRVLCVDTRFVSLDSWFIDGSILKYIDINYIESESLEEEDYQKYKISTGKVATCFDSSGRWFVFYEDENGGVGDDFANGSFANGSHLYGPFLDGALPGLQDKSEKEISCLISPDYGLTWYDFKGIVRTSSGDSVSNPKVVSNYFTNTIHLFYILNNTLMHKSINTDLFDYEDSFLSYKRPIKINSSTYPMYGLFHFSKNGQLLRSSPSNIVVGNIEGNYIKSQLEITQELIEQGRTDYRIQLSGDHKNYEDGFADIDFISFIDNSGNIKILFVANGKIFCRTSSNDGFSWYDIIEDGMNIHRNSKIQELRPIKFIGFAMSHDEDIAYITYHVDGMLFIRDFISIANSSGDVNIIDSLSPDSVSSPPIFVIGAIDPELKNAINKKESSVIFPYSDVDAFSNALSISETPALGYSTGGGLLRFFYKDASGNFRAFSYPEKPLLDFTYKKDV